MKIVSRVGLSQRAALALVEVDGRSFLIVHGEGYARVHATEPSTLPGFGDDEDTQPKRRVTPRMVPAERAAAFEPCDTDVRQYEPRTRLAVRPTVPEFAAVTTTPTRSVP